MLRRFTNRKSASAAGGDRSVLGSAFSDTNSPRGFASKVDIQRKGKTHTQAAARARLTAAAAASAPRDILILPRATNTVSHMRNKRSKHALLLK